MNVIRTINRVWDSIVVRDTILPVLAVFLFAVLSVTKTLVLLPFILAFAVLCIALVGAWSGVLLTYDMATVAILYLTSFVFFFVCCGLVVAGIFLAGEWVFMELRDDPTEVHYVWSLMNGELLEIIHLYASGCYALLTTMREVKKHGGWDGGQTATFWRWLSPNKL